MRTAPMRTMPPWRADPQTRTVASKRQDGPLNYDGTYRWNGLEWVPVKPPKTASRLSGVAIWRLALLVLVFGGLIAIVLTG